MSDETEDQWVFYVEGGVLYKQRPWCDCTREQRIKVLGRAQAKIVGYTKRDDGAWVRPCCMRLERAQFLARGGDKPIEHNPLSCRFCTEQIKTGSPVSTGNSEPPKRKKAKSRGK